MASDITGLSGISLSLRETQAPFKMELIPAAIGVAEIVYDLTDFLSLNGIADDQHAKSGKICTFSIHNAQYLYRVHVNILYWYSS